MRELDAKVITEAVAEMCIEANLKLSSEMESCIRGAADTEKSELGKKVLGQLAENMDIAGEDRIPICQDTGMAVLRAPYRGRSY